MCSLLKHLVFSLLAYSTRKRAITSHTCFENDKQMDVFNDSSIQFFFKHILKYIVFYILDYFFPTNCASLRMTKIPAPTDICG